MLQWEAYLKLEQMQRHHVEKRLHKKQQWLLYLLKTVGARRKGMGFKLVMFHAVLHVAEDIWMFGVPMNVDTGSNESHHKLTKLAAKLTQWTQLHLRNRPATAWMTCVSWKWHYKNWRVGNCGIMKMGMGIR